MRTCRLYVRVCLRACLHRTCVAVRFEQKLFRLSSNLEKSVRCHGAAFIAGVAVAEARSGR